MFRTLLARLRGELTIKQLVKRGLVIGKNCSIQKRVIIDDSHPWLIEIGDNVRIASYVHIIAHDGSAKNHLNGYTKIVRVKIGNNCFLASGVVVLPGGKIGDNSIIGAGSVVTHDIPENILAFGAPAKPVCTIDEYNRKLDKLFDESPKFDESYTLRGKITKKKKQEQKDALKYGVGFVK